MTIPEKSLLAILLNKDAYHQHKDVVDLAALKETFRELSYIYKTVYALHELTEEDLTVDEVEAYFWSLYPDGDKTVYGALFKSLSELSIKPEAGMGILAEIKARRGALKLSETAYKVAQGTATVEELQSLFDKEFVRVDHPTNNDEVYEVNEHFLEIMEAVNSGTGLRWRLDCLNKSLGSLRPGDFGFIFARPETGKTTFLASEIAFMLSQSPTSSVIWFNNEEQGYKVMCRVLQAYYGIPYDVLLSNLRKYYNEFNEQTNHRFQLRDAATVSRYNVEKIVDKHQPALVIYDQITKLKGFKADRNDLMLGDICQWARELAKNRHAAIGVSQADGTAEGVRYLTMEHVANAKTAMQAEADFILGIGKTHDQQQEYIRFLNISKNKLIGDSDSIPELRHGRFETMIEPVVARYRDLIKFD